jgi:hypothetical protein
LPKIENSSPMKQKEVFESPINKEMNETLKITSAIICLKKITRFLIRENERRDVNIPLMKD